MVDAISNYDHSTHQEFFDYYTKESQSEACIERMNNIFNTLIKNFENRGFNNKLNIADIGCGAGTMSLICAKAGHNAYGLDVNEALLAIASQRANAVGANVVFSLGSATHLPWENSSMDVCILPELLEHVVEWRACILEAIRVLKPNGILYVSTTNTLCPKQAEFNLPFYSWYPNVLKKYYERLAITSRPDIANYAKYPAVNWFSYYTLRSELTKLGLSSYDRFDIMEINGRKNYQKNIIKMIRRNSFLRFIGHLLTPYLIMVAIKSPRKGLL